MEIGGRQIIVPAVDLGVVTTQSERVRADDAALNDERYPIVEVDATCCDLNVLANLDELPAAKAVGVVACHDACAGGKDEET